MRRLLGVGGILGVVIVSSAGVARASCYPDGKVVSCTCANGLSGTRECMGRSMTGCVCEHQPPAQNCTVCGQPGTRVGSACLAAEICNGCDDDGNGVIDDGLKCMVRPLEPTCNGAVTIPLVPGLAASALVGARGPDFTLVSASSTATIWTHHTVHNSGPRSVLSPAETAWNFVPSEC